MKTQRQELNKILERCCKFMNVNISDAVKPERLNRECILTRQLYCYFARCGGFPVKDTAELINRHVSTVYRSTDVVSGLLAEGDRIITGLVEEYRNL